MAWRSLRLCRTLSRRPLPFLRPTNPCPIPPLLRRSHSAAAAAATAVLPLEVQASRDALAGDGAFDSRKVQLTQHRSEAAPKDGEDGAAGSCSDAVAVPKDEKVVGRDGSAPLKSSLNKDEVAKFAAIAETWWDSQGPFKPLHLMNPTRISFIRSALCRHFRKDPYSARPLEGLNIIDVGCGGGILSEPLARMGATVTGIDAVERNIKIASIHAESDPLTSSIEYHCTTAEELVVLNKKFDAVIALEVIEHVANPSEFCKSLAALTAPDGATLISTINRSMRSYATAIVTAEYILNWLPRGTHQWSSFLTPEELVLILQRASISVKEMAGFVYNPLTGEWKLSDDTSVNFIVFGSKESQ